MENTKKYLEQLHADELEVHIEHLGIEEVHFGRESLVAWMLEKGYTLEEIIERELIKFLSVYETEVYNKELELVPGYSIDGMDIGDLDDFDFRVLDSSYEFSVRVVNYKDSGWVTEYIGLVKY